MSSAVANIASTIQSASIKHHPDPAYDLNPSTAASEKRPVSPHSVSSSEASIPEYVLKPTPRRSNLPPLPDLRFEQSYLASLEGAETYWRIAWITGRDQVLLPLVQGTLWTLALSGWRNWNKGAAFGGQSLGARVRRWWWGVNNWKFEETTSTGTATGAGARAGVGARAGAGAGAGAGSGSAGLLNDEKFAEHIGDYYSTQFGSGARD